MFYFFGNSAASLLPWLSSPALPFPCLASLTRHQRRWKRGQGPTDTPTFWLCGYIKSEWVTVGTFDLMPELQICCFLAHCLSVMCTFLMLLIMSDAAGKRFLVISSGGRERLSVAWVESAKKSPSQRELKIIGLSSCTLDLLSTCYTNSIIRWVKF